MRTMKFFSTLTFLLLPLLIFANSQGDSLNYLTAQDSVFLTVDENNQKIIEHRLEKKQTMYSLAKFYGLEVIELYYYNEELEKMNEIPVGTDIRIPIPNKAIKRYKTKNFDETKHASLYYRVSKGDNLYHIAKRMFRMPIEDVQERNNIEGNNISPGQLLHVGWISTEGLLREDRKVKPIPPEWQSSQINGMAYMQAKGIKSERGERGVAAWNKKSKVTTKSFALHRSAPINSVMKVTNPMTKRTTNPMTKRTIYIKVTGRPSSKKYYGSNVIVVLSTKAAKMLGARDSRFHVNINYFR